MSKLRLKTVDVLLMAVFAQLLASCDGVSWTGPRASDESPSGYYLGTFTSTATQPSPGRETIGFISEEFEAQFLLSDQHYAGGTAVSGTTLEATLTEYRGRRGVFLGFDGIFSITLDGELSERDGIFGNYVGDVDEGRFALSYNSGYEEDSSYDLLSGMWVFNQASSGGALYTITLNIEGNGQLFGSDTAGCVFSGQVGIIDDRYGVYRATVSVSSCGEVGGDYSGLAFLAADFLYLGTDNGLFAFANQFQRL